MTNQLSVSIAVFFATLCLALFTSSTSSIAGDRELDVLLVNMTPDAESDDASSACVKQIQKIIKNDYSIITRLGETKLRKIVGHPDKTKGFLDWPAKDIEKSNKTTDTVVLIDCRPAAKSVDVVVSPPSGGVARIKIRKMTVNGKLTKALGASILRTAWVGFSP